MNLSKRVISTIRVLEFSGMILLSSTIASGLENQKGENIPVHRDQVISEMQSSSMQPSDQYEDMSFQWILYGEDKDKILGRTPNFEDVPKSLEEIVFTGKDPHQIELNEWELTALSRLVPLKRTIEREANRYMINPMWALMFYNLESQLNPSDHNSFSDDFGLGQIKRRSEILAKEIGTDPSNPFFSPHLIKTKSIFDPETNIIMSLILHRYNIEKYGLKNSDQTYAIYVRGEPGLNQDGTLSYLTKDILKGFKERYYIYQNIIPLFRIPSDETASIRDEDTRFLLGLYQQDMSIEEMYSRELNHFLTQLETKIDPDTKSVLMLDDCVTYAQTLDIAFGMDQTNNYAKLKSIGERFMQKTNGDLNRRTKVTYEKLERRL